MTLFKDGDIVAFGTGHRPTKLTNGGIDLAYSDELYVRLVKCAEMALEKLNPSPDVVISGMALGWDMALAQAALNLGIPLLAAVPFTTQSGRWKKHWQERYLILLSQAANVVVVSPLLGENPSYIDVAKALDLRNQWMVDNGTVGLLLWDGDKRGGTANCVRYVQKTKPEMPLYNYWASWEKYSGFMT